MYTATFKNPTLEHLSHLPAFAQYLLQQRLHDFTRHQLAMSRELNLPLLEQLAHLNEQELFELSLKNTEDFLRHLVDNKAQEHMEQSVRMWMGNQMPGIERNSVRPEDIHMVAYIRKMTFVHFIEEYAASTSQVLDLVREIDLYTMQLQMITTRAFIELLKENLDESTHFIHKVNETIPGAVYVFDIINFKGIFSNSKISDVIGYTQEELNEHGQVIGELVHPEDRQMLAEKISTIKLATDNEIISYKYRIRKKDGSYKWMRNFESVFRRNENGEATESIGITLDVDREHKAADALRENENLYKRAEAITHIGSFHWQLATSTVKWSEELYRIHGMDPQQETIDFEKAIAFCHVEDLEGLREAYQQSIAEKKPLDYYYRIHCRDNSVKILHVRGELVMTKEGEVESMIGTAQDVTEKQNLIRKLEHGESIHRQAEELTNMGSWTWNLSTNQIEWSEQMYKIYEIDEPVQFDVFTDFIHPDDRELANTILQKLLKEKYSDHSFRIITRSGKVKKLHTIARVHSDRAGNPAYIIGAEQDITEKENLLDKLKKSEHIYKQAEELANMGNWSWDVATGKLEWTDQLYRIYGLEPQGEAMTIHRFLSLVHPDDRDRVREGIMSIREKDLVDDIFRIVTPQGKIRILKSIAQVQRNASGVPEMVIGSERDITEKQTLIDRLQQSEALYKQAQMLTHVGNWSWDIGSGVLTWSDELYRIYGLEPQSSSIDYARFLELIYPDDRDKVRSIVDQAYATGLFREFTHRVQRPGGEVRILLASGEVLRDEKGLPYMMIGTAQDITERQSLIDRLQESEKLFKQAQGLAHMGSWTMDVRTREFSWSDEMYNIFEVPKGEHFDFEKWLSHVPAEDRTEVMDYYDECLRDKKMYDRIHRIILHNGKVKTVHRKAEFILDEYGEAVRMIGTTQDITEEYRIQQELKENQMFIQKITDATPSIIASYNINTGQYVYISEGIEKLLGYSREDIMEQGVSFFSEIIHPDDLVVVMERNNKALETANADPSRSDLVVEFSYRMRHQNGAYRWFHTYGTIFDRNAEGLVEHVLNISLDITEQMLASETIKEQEHFIQQIADASPTILYLYDVATQSIVYINREIFFVLGYAPDEIVDMKDKVTEKLYHPEDYLLLPARKQSTKNFQQVDSMIQYECRMKNKQEEWRWLLVREIVFKSDDQGNVRQILGAALDINKRKEMEKTILQNTMLLEQSNASLEEFAYVASHDLKEPLRKISTFGDRLVASQGEHMTPEGKVYLQKIVDASHRMQTMINDLLSISMITGNTAFERYSLQKVLEETLQTLEHKLEQQNALISSDPLPEALIIPFQFRQLFQNLLSNSLKFVRPGVRPQIQIHYQCLRGEEKVMYGLTRAEAYHQISFTDNGIGFDNDYAGKIFAIFQRLHGRSEYEGSGIGLAICKKIVEHHGGIIYASGQEDNGATFTIVLPA